jgi:hypothetical protein
MGLLSKLFGSKKPAGKHDNEHNVIVHFEYGSTNLQHVFALEELLHSAIAEAGVGKYDYYEVAEDGSDGFFYMYGPDAEALYRAISPVLAESSFMRGATVTLWFGPRRWGISKRVIQLPS